MSSPSLRSLWRWWLPPMVLLGALGLGIALWTASVGNGPIVYETVPGAQP